MVVKNMEASVLARLKTQAKEYAARYGARLAQLIAFEDTRKNVAQGYLAPRLDEVKLLDA